MAAVELSDATPQPSRPWPVSACERRGDALFPPKVTPPARMPNTIQFLRLMLRDPLHSVPPEAYHEPVVMRRWPVPLAYACGPEAVRDVLVDRRDEFARKPAIQRYILGPLLGNGILLAEGQDWRWQRQTTAPLFRHGEVLSYVPTMAAAAQHAIDDWARAADPVQPIAADMTHATYEVIARTMLIGGSKEITQTTDDEDEDYSAGFPWAVAYGLFRMPSWVPRPGGAAMLRRDKRLRTIVGGMIDEKARAVSADHDLLARLREARHPDTGQQMSREQLIDNVLTFLLAGHHTTAMALTWSLYLVACAPEWEARMLDEIEHVVPNGQIEAQHVAKLTIVQQVLKESMRLFPPVPMMSRVATQDTKLGGQSLRRGTVVNIPVYVIHRHHSAWHDPDRFDPARFTKDNERNHASCQFLPFGAGPRICSGMAFAMVEATVFLATFIRAARFELVSDDFSPEPISRVILAPRGGMPLKVTMRC